jgi:LacI family transcriptional regulator
MDGGDMIMITISDIARETGLSTATVSNALSGKGRVSDARRKQIIEMATRMGYDFSRIRVAQPQRGIAVIVESLSVIFCIKIAEGICRAAEENGYQVKLYNLDIIHGPEDFNPPREYMRQRLERLLPQLDAATLGAIYISQYPRDVTGIMPPTPFPVVYAYCYTGDGTASVNTDDQKGAYIATQHLLSIGKRRIAMLSGPINSIPMTKRFSGYQRALIDAGMSVDLRLVKTGDWDIGHSCQIAAELLRLDPAPDGIFCQSDHIALGVCRAISEAGLSIPGDIAVVGFDNYDFADFVSPSLTTIDQPLAQIGNTAFLQLRKVIEKQAVGERNLLLDARLIRRQSA